MVQTAGRPSLPTSSRQNAWQRPPRPPAWKQNTTKSLSSRRSEYVSGVAERRPAAQNITSVFFRTPHLFRPGSAT
jgi:hypothetical protein